MKQKEGLNNCELTEDEVHWLGTVIRCGGEVTTFLQQKHILSEDEDWRQIQFKLFRKVSKRSQYVKSP